MIDKNISHETYDPVSRRVVKVSRDGRMETGRMQPPPKNIPKQLWNRYIHSEGNSEKENNAIVEEYVRRTHR